MAKIKINCPHCGKAALQCDETRLVHRVKCPHCKEKFPAPQTLAKAKPVKVRRLHRHHRRPKKKLVLIITGLALVAMMLVTGLWFWLTAGVHWQDRRPIGVLFLASNYHSSATNPRGWFNDPKLDVVGVGGYERFHKALQEYTDRSIEILKRTGAQGVIVWDLEGEQYPHKTTFIGSPREFKRLAPEMDAVADEFFARLRDAGFKVGITIRPQELVFEYGTPQQKQVVNTERVLREKIDYAKRQWGATLFYIDSNGGVRRPDEILQLRALAKERPDCLLIPEHHWAPYWAFSTPYVSLRKGKLTPTPHWIQHLFPDSFRAIDISDGEQEWAAIAAAQSQGDILLFRAWCESAEVNLLANMAQGTREGKSRPRTLATNEHRFMRLNEQSLYFLLLLILCVGLTGCGSISSVEPLAGKYEEVTYA